MVKSTKSRVEEEDGEDDEEVFDRHDSFSRKVKVDAKSGQQKVNSMRAKHSETEQRRRSKINERFQILRDLVPQNDQKRDKASLLLEVIEHVQFLQEKLHAYEGSCQGWSQEPTRLSSWRSQHEGVESFFVDHSEVMKNGSAHKNNGVHNSVESDFRLAEAYKLADQLPGSTTQAVSQQNMFAPVGSSLVPTQPLQDLISHVENMASQPQSKLEGGPSSSDCPVTKSSLKEQEKLTVEGGSVSISSAYSQGILNDITQALRSSGVDLSQTRISVEIDVGKQSNNRPTAMASDSKNHENQAP